MTTSQQNEMEMWKSYRDTGNKEYLSQLLNSFDPLIQREVNVFKTAPIPNEAIKLQAQILAKKAFDTYDPTRGVQINTHIVNNLKKLNRFIYENQNLAKIPEHRILRITEFKSIKDQLREKLWREPTAMEIASEMKISPAEVERLESELRQDLVIQNESTDDAGGGFFLDAQKFTDYTKDAIIFVYHSVDDPKVQILIEYYFGINGKPKSTIQAAATHAGMNYGKAVRVLKDVAEQIAQTQENLK